MRPLELLLASTLALVAACTPSGGGTPAPLLPDPGSDGVYSVDWPELGRGEARYITIDLGSDAVLVCRRVSPKFPFDSAKARAQDRAQLAALASCLNHPEMTDRTVRLIGRESKVFYVLGEVNAPRAYPLAVEGVAGLFVVVGLGHHQHGLA